MAFDFSTLVTDRTQQDVAYARQLAEKLVAGTATEEEKAEWNSFTLKGVYNHTDLNRVTAAMEVLKAKLESYGYLVPGYEKVKITHPTFGGGSNLPDDYIELEYIQSTGTQYIDTGFKPNQDTKVVMDVKSQSGIDHVLFSARTSASSNVFEMIWSNSSNCYRFYYNNSNVNMDGISVTPATRRTIVVDKNVATIDGYSVSRTYSAFQCECNMVLFARNTVGTIGAYTTGKLYSCQVFDNGALIRDYIPCVNPSGDVGLFDVVSQQFYGNSGTGVFTAGSRTHVNLPSGYTRLAYIESTGTQYIDTGVLVTANMQLDMTFIPNTDGQNDNAMLGASWSNDGFLLTAYRGNVRFHSKGYYRDLTKKPSELNTISCSPTSVAINGETYDMTGTGSDTQAYPIYLFWVGDESSPNNKGYYKLYSCRIYDNGTIVRDYIPCINPSGNVGLFDVANQQFYSNSGTGVFTAGDRMDVVLPSGYTRLTHIESTGTQYINTGFKPNQDTRVVADLEFTGPHSSHPFLFGARDSSGTAEFYAYVNGGGTLTAPWAFVCGSSLNQHTKTGEGRQAVSFDNDGMVVNGVSASVTVATFQNTVNLWLFCANKNGVTQYLSSLKLYSCQIYDNGTLIRDFVPCKNSGGVFGLYDLANGVFYQNAGTGVFTAGEEVAAPATASAMVVSDDVTEYDPYTWYEFDWPTTETMTIYLLNVAAIRSVLAVMKSTPKSPSDAFGLMAQEANDIEAILLDVYRQLTIMPTTFIPCGEALCGGDNL